MSFRNSSECSLLNLFYYCLLRKCNCLSKMVSRTKLCVSARRFLHAQRQSRAKRNSSKRRTCNAVALRTLDMPKETYPYIHSGCRFSTFHPATGKSASLSDVGKFVPRLLVHVQVAHRQRPSQNQPYVEYANPSGRESLATNPCVVEINCVQKFETRQTSASCMTACYFKSTKAPIKASRDCFLTSRTTRVNSAAMDVCKTIGNGRRERASELQKSRYRIHEEPLQNEQTKHKTSSGHETKSGAKIEKTTCAIL